MADKCPNDFLSEQGQRAALRYEEGFIGEHLQAQMQMQDARNRSTDPFGFVPMDRHVYEAIDKYDCLTGPGGATFDKTRGHFSDIGDDASGPDNES